MNTSGRFEFPTELAVTGAEYSVTHDAPVHRRESLMSSIAESEGSASSSEDSDASLEGETDDEKEEESKAPNFDFVQRRRMLAAMMANQQRSANMDTTADVSPPKPSLPRDVKIAMLREFGDVLYTSVKGTTLQSPNNGIISNLDGIIILRDTVKSLRKLRNALSSKRSWKMSLRRWSLIHPGESRVPAQFDATLSKRSFFYPTVAVISRRNSGRTIYAPITHRCAFGSSSNSTVTQFSTVPCTRV